MKLLSTILLLLLSLSVYSQNQMKFPIWTFNTNSTTIYGLSLGYMHTQKIRNVTTNGLRIEALGFGALIPLMPGSLIATSDSIYNKIINQKTGEIINGINISPIGHGGDISVNGINIYGFGSIITKSNGLSVGLFLNSSQRHNGIQVAILGNMTYNIKGVQVAFFNYNENEVVGIQIGIINKTSKIKGLQIGLWNKNKKRSLPIINW